MFYSRGNVKNFSGNKNFKQILLYNLRKCVFFFKKNFLILIILIILKIYY